MKLCMQVGLGTDHIVLDGDPALPPQRGTIPQFSVHICCGQMAGWIKMPLGMEVGLGPGDFVLGGDPAPPPPKGAEPPIFGPCPLLPNGWIDQDGTWHGGGLGPGHIVLDEDPAPLPKKGAEPPPIFGPRLLWANGWMDQDATWYRDRPRHRQLCVRWGPSSPSEKGGGTPNFWPMSMVTKSMDGSRRHLI